MLFGSFWNSVNYSDNGALSGYNISIGHIFHISNLTSSCLHSDTLTNTNKLISSSDFFVLSILHYVFVKVH